MLNYYFLLTKINTKYLNLHHRPSSGPQVLLLALLSVAGPLRLPPSGRSALGANFHGSPFHLQSLRHLHLPYWCMHARCGSGKLHNIGAYS